MSIHWKSFRDNAKIYQVSYLPHIAQSEIAGDGPSPGDILVHTDTAFGWALLESDPTASPNCLKAQIVLLERVEWVFQFFKTNLHELLFHIHHRGTNDEQLSTTHKQLTVPHTDPQLLQNFCWGLAIQVAGKYLKQDATKELQSLSCCRWGSLTFWWVTVSSLSTIWSITHITLPKQNELIDIIFLAKGFFLRYIKGLCLQYLFS